MEGRCDAVPVAGTWGICSMTGGSIGGVPRPRLESGIALMGLRSSSRRRVVERMCLGMIRPRIRLLAMSRACIETDAEDEWDFFWSSIPMTKTSDHPTSFHPI